MKQSGLSLALCLVWILPLAHTIRFADDDLFFMEPFYTPDPTTPAPTTTTPTTPATTTPPEPDMSYWVSFSKTVHPGGVLKVKVYAPTATASFTLRLELMNRAGKVQQDGQEFTLQATDKVQTVEFKISKALKRQYGLYLRANATGGMAFDGFERMTWSNKRLSIFIQTDKAVYKPGETIRFRTLVMYPDIRVATDKPMDIVIMDPNNNMLRRWDAVKGSHSGVFQGEMPTSLYPPLGDWKIKVKVDGEKMEKKFKVKEYELPRFEVTTKFPSYALNTQKSVTANISAKYVFGLPVRGASGKIVASVYMRPPITVEKEFKLDRSGNAIVNIPTKQLEDAVRTKRRWKWYRLSTVKFQTTVTDSATNDAMTDKTSLRFYRYSAKVTFTRETPSAFKPGLPFTAFIEVLQPDNTPIANPQSVSVNFVAKNRIRRKWTPRWGMLRRRRWHRPRWPRWKETVLVNKTLSLDSKARTKVTITSVPKGVTSLNMVASVSNGLKGYKYVRRFVSKANVFLQMKFTTTKPKIGDFVEVLLTSNENLRDITYQVFSKGDLVECKKLRLLNPGKRSSFAFRVTSAMAPFLDVLAFFKTTGGEVVADRLVMALEEFTDNEVSINFTDTEVKPGARTQLKISAEAGTSVFMLAVDKSVKLLGKGNDITHKDVFSELRKYSHGGIHVWRGLWYCCSYASNAGSIFRGAKAGIITDGVIPGRNKDDVPNPYRKNPIRRRRPWLLRRGRPVFARRMRFRAFASRRKVAAPGAKANTPAEQLRKFFPETWLWQTVGIKGCGPEILNLTAPDTITSWVATAFGVHHTKGLTVAKKPAKLLTIKRLFVTLDLPYSAVRGEDVCFKALTFNNYNSSVDVSITLAKNCTAFKSIFVKANPYNPRDVVEIRKSATVTKKLGKLASGGMAVTTFCISPQSLGDMPVQVTLHANRPADGLVRTMRIKPEGVERSQSYPVLMELTSTGMFSKSIDLRLPEGIVPGSLRIIVQAVGDVLGGTAENLGDLLKMPYGCGEQNLVHLAPNTYLILYLRKTGRLTPAILKKAQTFMLAGYQRQLNYQRYDGSFSAFGKRDKSGSLWLTAFVVKCFVQAAALGKDIITIDPKVVLRAITWIKRYQNSDGSFREPGKVIHKAMQGGSAQGVPLAAYVTIALTEAKKSYSGQMGNRYNTMVKDSLTKAVRYLESKLPTQWTKNDSYVACIVTYALCRAGSSKAALALTLMDKLAVDGDLLKYWKGPPPPAKKTRYPWYHKTQPLNVEMTAYALLAMMQKRPVTSGIPVVRWLNKQRTPNGGFISTQDTVVGMEALTAMTDLALGSNFSPIKVSVTWFSGKLKYAYLSIDKSNVMLLQKVHLPLVNDKKYPQRIGIKATSTVPKNERMFALAQVTAYYNIKTTTAKQVFQVRPTILNSTTTSFVLQVCVSRVDKNTSPRQSMIVAEVAMPSGHTLDKKVSMYGSSSKQDFKRDRVVLYYYELDRKEDCSSLTLRMTSGVGHVKPPSIIVYDYYFEDDEVTVFYHPPDRGTCDVGSREKACVKV